MGTYGSHMETIVAQARVRERNQLTIPDLIVRAAAIGPGETFVVEVSSDVPDVVVLRRVRASYAGALRGMYGDPGSYLDGERGSWE